ncbi:hypothetical protein CEXT_441861 [Caerostris extrusa]|uniref:Uncharacterized protein n=1 Tax=Caerostris extrusa TaxID=172846 RepID=A0AAV4V7I5_CAEEX|nr:hypothetical protein CEXT_441861 [Caerostris extrusa]
MRYCNHLVIGQEQKHQSDRGSAEEFVKTANTPQPETSRTSEVPISPILITAVLLKELKCIIDTFPKFTDAIKQVRIQLINFES